MIRFRNNVRTQKRIFPKKSDPIPKPSCFFITSLCQTNKCPSTAAKRPCSTQIERINFFSPGRRQEQASLPILLLLQRPPHLLGHYARVTSTASSSPPGWDHLLQPELLHLIPAQVQGNVEGSLLSIDVLHHQRALSHYPCYDG